MSGGIYRIVNLVDNKCYVGQTHNFNYRKGLHFSELRNDKHKNDHLQNAFNKYGEQNFVFEILERVIIDSTLNIVEKRDILVPYEQKWIDFYRSNDMTFGYNKSPSAGSTAGLKQSAEHIAKRVAKIRGYRFTEQSRDRLSKAKSTQKYVLTYPDGHSEIISNLTKFSRELGLTPSLMFHVLSGLQTQHKGYRVKRLAS